MGLYEPVVVLGVVLGIYAATASLRYKTKQTVLWWSVAVILAIGAIGAGRELLLYGSLSSTPFQD